MDNIHICPLCHGSGFDPYNPDVLDTKAGKYTEEMNCPKCKASGYDPRYHAEIVAEFHRARVQSLSRRP